MSHPMSSPTVRHRRGSDLPWGWVSALALALLTFGIMIWLIAFRLPQGRAQRVALSHQLTRQGHRVDALATLGAQNQSKLKALGQKPVGPPAASVSAGKATPPPTQEAPVSPAPTYVQSIKPTQAQVKAGVDAWFREHPPKSPISSATLVAKMIPYVTSYLKRHPAPPGKTGPSGAPCDVAKNPDCQGPAGQDAPPPSDAQVATAVQTFLPSVVAAYFAANPVPSGPAGPSGSPGAQGPQGPGPTEDQIATQVRAYFTDHPLACGDGYSAGTATVVTDTGPLLIQACIADDQPTTPTTSAPPPSPTPTETPS
jgi:hypothetical protein